MNTPKVELSNTTLINQEQNICRPETIEGINWQKIGEEIMSLADIIDEK